MWKSIILPLALAAIAPLAEARNCKEGLNYCGSTLKNIGRYNDQIFGALTHKGQHVDGAHQKNSLFHCVGGQGGDIHFVTYCERGCKDNLHDADDVCR